MTRRPGDQPDRGDRTRRPERSQSVSTEPLIADPGHEVADHGHDPHATTTGLSHIKLAMWVFLGSECLLFGGLISTYLLYKTRVTGAPFPPTCSTSRSRR